MSENRNIKFTKKEWGITRNASYNIPRIETKISVRTVLNCQETTGWGIDLTVVIRKSCVGKEKLINQELAKSDWKMGIVSGMEGTVMWDEKALIGSWVSGEDELCYRLLVA